LVIFTLLPCFSRFFLLPHSALSADQALDGWWRRRPGYLLDAAIHHVELTSIHLVIGLWLSLVARAVWRGEFQGSNPCSPIGRHKNNRLHVPSGLMAGNRIGGRVILVIRPQRQDQSEGTNDDTG
jgi:hypothetical protein